MYSISPEQSTYMMRIQSRTYDAKTSFDIRTTASGSGTVDDALEDEAILILQRHHW